MRRTFSRMVRADQTFRLDAGALKERCRERDEPRRQSCGGGSARISAASKVTKQPSITWQSCKCGTARRPNSTTLTEAHRCFRKRANGRHNTAADIEIDSIRKQLGSGQKGLGPAPWATQAGNRPVACFCNPAPRENLPHRRRTAAWLVLTAPNYAPGVPEIAGAALSAYPCAIVLAHASACSRSP